MREEEKTFFLQYLLKQLLCIDTVVGVGMSLSYFQ